MKARQKSLSMKQIEERISRYLPIDERKDINKGRAYFWESM